MKKNNFPERKIGKKEVWTKQCSKNCNGFIPDEYQYCDYCLLSIYEIDRPDIIGNGACESGCFDEVGYSSNKVAMMLRRALGETVVKFS